MVKNYNKNIVNLELLIFILFFFVTTFISIFGGICLFFCYLLLYKNSYSKLSFIFIAYLYAIIAFTQYSTINTTDYDIIRYYTTYHFFSELNVSEGWQSILVHGDIFFYTIVYILSQLFPDDPRILSFFFTFVTSTLLFLSIDNFVFKYSGKKRYNLFSVVFWIFSFFLISSFPNMTNVFRQFLGISIFLYGVSIKELNKRYIIIFVLAILTHWILVVYIILYVIISKFRNNLNSVLFIIPIISIIINLVLPNFNFTARINAYLFGEEILGIDKTILVIGLIVQVILIYILSKYKGDLCNFHILSLISLSYNLVFITNSTLAIRNFYFIGFLITLIYIVIINSFPTIFYNNRKRIKFDIILFLLIFYNIKTLLLGGSKYLIFDNNDFLLPFLDLLKSKFPIEML